jgi:hypothetical protein
LLSTPALIPASIGTSIPWIARIKTVFPLLSLAFTLALLINRWLSTSLLFLLLLYVFIRV